MDANAVRRELDQYPITFLAFFQCLFRSFALGNVQHDAAQPDRLIILDHNGHDIVQPNDAAIGRDHPIFKIVRTFRAGCVDTKAGRPFSVVGMNVIFQKVGSVVQRVNG